MDPPDIIITEGGRKLRTLLSPSSTRFSTYQSTVDPIETVVENPSIVQVVPVTANQGDVNEEGVTDDMDWSAMGQEEVKYQLNDAD